MEIILPKFTSYQQEVFDWLYNGELLGTGKQAVIRSVRQSGKTHFCSCLLIKVSLENVGTSVVFEPSLEQSRNVYNIITKALAATDLIESSNSQTLTIQFTNGSTILFKSTAQENSNRGYTVSNILILDECAYLQDESIFTILPLVNAHNAPIIICSTPFTRDGFYYQTYCIGESNTNPNIKSFDWSKHPEISRFLTAERKAFYKQTMSRAKYTTEVDGDFLSDDGLLFTNLDACTKKPNEIGLAYIGIDFATGSDGDYTVLSVFNENGEQYAIYRTNNQTPMQQVEWLAGLINNINSIAPVKSIFAEKNSIGFVYIDALEKKLPKDIKITDWITTNKSKQDLVTNFQIGLENEYLSILPDNNLHNELKSYSSEINQKTKNISYNAKTGHDDMVIATMLSYKAYKDGGRAMYSVSSNKNKMKYKTLSEKYG